MRWAAVRWTFAALLLAASAFLMQRGLRHTGFGAAAPVLFSLGSFVSAVLLITPETALRLAEWIGSFFANLFFPSETLSKPPLSYHMARHYRRCGRLEDSLSHYQSIVQHYPAERQAYLELLEVAHLLGDTRSSKRVTAQFQRQFGQPPPPPSSHHQAT